jgi:ABC-2 type transport system permease protein
MQNLAWVPFFTYFKKELKRFIRVLGQTVITPVISSTLYLLIFGVSLGFRIEIFDGQISYLDFLIPGLIMMGVLNNSFQNTTSSISISKFHGELEAIKMAPLSNSQIIWGMSLASLVRGLLVGLIVYSVGTIFSLLYKGKWIALEHPLITVLFLLIGGITFSFLGIVIGFKSKSYDQINAFGTFILVPLMYLGGIFFPLDDLHLFWRAVSKFNPLLYFINGMRYGILGISDISWVFCTYMAFGTCIILLLLAYWALSKGSFQRW